MTDFLTKFRQQAISEKIEIGDTIIVRGSDEFKGFRGTVTGIKQVSGENKYTVELQANSAKIERKPESLTKCYD